MMTLGGEIRLGLFIVMAGGLASVLRRYTNLSPVGAVLVGCVGSGLIATLIIEPAEMAAEDILASEAARAAFVGALAAQEEDIIVEARGPGSVTVWFTVPDPISGECGEYPGQEVRTHLGDLGFHRIVVRDRSETGGICTFRP